MADEFKIETKLDQPAVAAGRSSEVYSLVTIRPNRDRLGALLESSAPSLPAHLMVIVDVSGSMWAPMSNAVTGFDLELLDDLEPTSSSRLMVALRVVQKLVGRMESTDRMTLVAFEHEAHLLADSLPVGRELDAAVNRLRDIGGGGTTLKLALERVRKTLGQSGVSVGGETRRIVLLTDGEDSDPVGAIKVAEDLGAKYHVPIIAFGTGESHADFLMDLSKTTLGGSFDNIASEQDAEDCFAKFLTGQKNILATNVNLQLWLAPEIFVRELYRTKPEVLFVGDLQPDSNNSVPIAIEYMERGKLYEFLFRSTVSARDPGRFRLAKATLTYDVPALGVSGERVEANIVIEYTTDEARAQIRLGDVRKEIANAETQRQVLFLIEKKALLDSGQATEKDKAVIAKLLDTLVKKFEERGDTANLNSYRQMQAEYAQNGVITQEMMNRSLAASSKVAGAVAVVDIDDF